MTNKRRRMTGVVTKAGLQKTVTVRVDRSSRHPLYGKVVRTSNKYLVHDEIGCTPGDKVRIVESRPISRRKRWVVEEILQRVIVAESEPGKGERDDAPQVEAEA